MFNSQGSMLRCSLPNFFSIITNNFTHMVGSVTASITPWVTSESSASFSLPSIECRIFLGGLQQDLPLGPFLHHTLHLLYNLNPWKLHHTLGLTIALLILFSKLSIEYTGFNYRISPVLATLYLIGILMWFFPS